jgi:hypothetical protein
MMSPIGNGPDGRVVTTCETCYTELCYGARATLTFKKCAAATQACHPWPPWGPRMTRSQDGRFLAEMRKAVLRDM